MTEHRYTRRLVGVTAIVGLSALGATAIAMGHDGTILTAISSAIVAVVVATLRKIDG